MTETAVVEVENLSKTFRVGFVRRRVDALRGISFDVRRGEILGLIGHNGAGKTTTLKTLTGLVKADHGTVRLFGEDARNREARERIGYMPEGPYFYEHLTAPELLRFYGKLFGIPRRELTSRIDTLLHRVGLSDAADRPIKKFSKGMRQRAGIAQALINDPELVILDEPQSGLDPIGRKEIKDLIAELGASGKTVLLASHVLPDVEALADRVVLLAKGRVIASGSVHELTGDTVQGWEVVVRGEPPETRGDFHFDAAKRGSYSVLTLAPESNIDEFVAKLIDSRCSLHSVVPRTMTLEHLYVSKTEKETAHG